MINITKNHWRPFIELHQADTGCTVYFDVTKRPTIIQYDDGTELFFNMNESIIVQEPATEIIAAVDRLIEAEQDRKAEQAKEYFAATQARVAETAKLVEAE